ncbi:transglutaminase-like domain-containing protein [Alienimonas chondri]|uniref:Transglutaminase-like domain-containing protein n=1 Tax=Alienimonas chondri TaxID=2681879 RepID=A0ABX1VFD0_9PLAN|nr:transglutaminase domain-containing protein [Alienimonas chondri]NNJ25756.1 hypothetical protein [Alienimonas chondri]
MLRFAPPPFAALLLAAVSLPALAQDEPVVPAAPDGGAAVGVAEELTADVEDTTWGVIALGDERIGWTRTVATPLGENGDASARTEVETNMTFRRFGQTIKMAVELSAEETADGGLRAYTLVTKNPGAAPTKAVGERVGDVMQVTSTVNGQQAVREIPVPGDVKGPSYLETVLAGDELKPGRPVSFKAFFPDLEKVGTTTLSIAPNAEAVETPTGETRTLTAVTVTHDILPISTTLYVDEDGEAAFDSTFMLGQEMVTYEVSKEEALRAVFGKGGDVGFDTLVAVETIPNVHQTQQVVYEVTVEEADPAELFLATASQTVEPLDERRARVTVKRLPIPASATAGVAPNLLKSTRYLQSDDPRVIAHAEAAAPADAPAGTVAVGCTEYVGRVLTNKNFSTALASAAEVAENLAGDCTEHSVLCAAMLRARGIPARVCVGLVTIPGRGQMGGHMWVEALLDADGPVVEGGGGDGEAIWIPLDPTMTGGGIGGGHLLLGRSDLSDDDAAPVASFLPMLEVIGRLTVKVVESK